MVDLNKIGLAPIRSFEMREVDGRWSIIQGIIHWAVDSFFYNINAMVS